MTQTTDSAEHNKASTQNPSHKKRSHRRPANSIKKIIEENNKSEEQSKGQNKQVDKTEQKDSQADSNEEHLCFICTEPIKYSAIGNCNHASCHMCCLRLRALYKNKSCAYCKTELNAVVITDDLNAQFQDIPLSDCVQKDEKLDIHYHKEKIFEIASKILQFNCPFKSCKFISLTGWEGIQSHVSSVHHKLLCNLCIEHKKVFAHEHLLFSKAQLAEHAATGKNPNPKKSIAEDDGFRGHPKCGFCKINFFDNEQLFEHCRHKHEQCHICIRQGRDRDVYYQSYRTLEQHFRKKHYLCPERSCLDKKFIVFDTDIDLKDHFLIEHPNALPGQRSKNRQALLIDLNIAHDSDADDVPTRRMNIPSGFGQLSTPPASRSPIQNQATPVSNSRPVSSNTSPRVLMEAQWPGLAGPAPAPAPQAPAASATSHSSYEFALPSSIQSRINTIFAREPQKISQYRFLTGKLISRELNPMNYIQSVRKLIPLSETGQKAIDKLTKLVNGVDALLEESRSSQFQIAWRDYKLQNSFPSLSKNQSSAPSTSSTTSRKVLVIKKTNEKSFASPGIRPPPMRSLPTRSLAAHAPVMWNTPSQPKISKSEFPSLPAKPKATSANLNDIISQPSTSGSSSKKVKGKKISLMDL